MNLTKTLDIRQSIKYNESINYIIKDKHEK